MLIRSCLFLVFFSLFGLLNSGLSAQTAAWRDSIQNRIKLLNELVQADNFEDAQIEAGEFRSFLHNKFIFCPPKAVPLISGVYWHNKDKKSAFLFLAECESDANRDRNPDNKMALLQAISKEHERWGNTERAQITTALLRSVQDTLISRRQNKQTKNLQLRLDSLEKALTVANEVKLNTVSIDKDRLLVLAGGIALILIALVAFHAYSSNRWRNKLIRQEQEFDLRLTALREAMPASIPSNIEITPQNTSENQQEPEQISHAYQSYNGAPPLYNQGERQTALIIEPNRQIALYVRSLLNSNFEVVMSNSPIEGLKMANELLPDLIICDTQLEQLSGIEITRQLKLAEKTNHIPVILLSRHFGNDGRLDALRAGADAWFTRPVLNDEFGGEILKLMAAKYNKQEEFNRFLQLHYSDNAVELAPGFLKEIVTYIETHIANPNLAADEIARKMQLSNVHFVKKLKALTGKEPVQLMRELRLEKAKYLLEKQAGNPQTIATLVGFDNPGTFAMAFKDYFGENTLLLRSGSNKSLLNG